MTVVLILPNLSNWAAPKKPIVILPPCNQYRNISGTATVVIAVSHSSPSPMDNGKILGAVPIVPLS